MSRVRLIALASACLCTPLASIAATPLTTTSASTCSAAHEQQQTEHIATLEAELARDRGLMLDLRTQIASLRGASPGPSIAQSVEGLATGTQSRADASPTNADALNAKGLERYAHGDAEAAVPLFRQAANAGHVGAMENLALMYLNGKGGVAQDPRQAVALLERASEKGSVTASENLGRMYQLALGVGFNRDHAIKWYQRAQVQGSQEAAAHIDALRAMPPRSR